MDFVPSPVAIGGDVINEFAMVPTACGFLRALHVEDVVKDRLNKYVCYMDMTPSKLRLPLRVRSKSRWIASRHSSSGDGIPPVATTGP